MENGIPLVTVIMIFLNAEQFIAEAIQSVFDQSYPHWELLLVDDGSTDRSTAIAKRYAADHPGNICYLDHPEHENRGMSASRNLGIAHAQGEYIAFLDSDDIWFPDKLKHQVAVLENLPEAGMVYSTTQWWYSWTGRPEDASRDFVLDPGIEPNTMLPPPELLIRFLPRENISPCTCSVLLRRKAVEQVGGFEERFRGLYEDQAFFAKISLSTAVFVSPICVARYRQHAASNCSIAQEDGQYAAARLNFLNWLSARLKSQRYEHRDVWRALDRELRIHRYSVLFRLFNLARQGFPGQMYRRMLRLKISWPALPFFRQLRCLQFRRVQPFGNGRQRGTPIVRYYWDRFLQIHQADIRGTVLEIGTTATVRRYGGQNIFRADAIDLQAHSPEITIVGDLSRADHVPSDRYDCFINQFTTHLIFDIEAALYHSIRMLKPGGILLINFPCLDYYFSNGLDMGTGQPLFMYWWFTPIQVENHLRRMGLTENDYSLQCCGNLFTRIAYQMNMPAEELTQHELDFADVGHPLLICARVVKPTNWLADKPLYKTVWQPQVKPAQWNPITGHYS